MQNINSELMSRKENVHFKKYKLLLQEIDKHVANLEDAHSKHMKCKNGCDLCCIDFSIFPIEFHYIFNNIKNDNAVLEAHSKKDACTFLKNHSCTIYQYRPIMCRTHGLPLIYANDEGELELSSCHLNFTEFNFEDFTMENTLPQDKYNSKLFLLNKEFIAEFKDIKYDEFDLIPLKELANRLKTEPL